MSNVLVGGAGAAVGLLIALLGNLFVLPLVLDAQRNRANRAFGFPGSKEQVALATTTVYRVVMPILFAIVGWVGATSIFGGPV
jgi:hypothetical protein